MLDLGFYDPAAALWAAGTSHRVLALRHLIDLVTELEHAAAAAKLSSLQVRLALEPVPAERNSYDVALVLAPFFLGNAPVRSAIHAAAAALKPEGKLYLQVHRRHGAETYAKYARELFEVVEPLGIGAGHRRLLLARGPQDVPEIESTTSTTPTSKVHEEVLRGVPLRLRLAAGVFAARGVDPGSRLLLSAADVPLGATLLDLGCGAGTLGLAFAAADPEARVTLVDSSRMAVELATENVALNELRNADVHVGDGYEPVDGRRFDAIVSNVPAHRGHAADHSVAERFIAGAPAHLSEDGALWLVANRALTYEIAAARAFRHVTLAAADGRYKVLQCTEPRRG